MTARGNSSLFDIVPFQEGDVLSTYHQNHIDTENKSI